MNTKGSVVPPRRSMPADVVREKVALLAGMVREARHVVVHTGAGVSTSAGIPDFRGPNGGHALSLIHKYSSS